MKKIGLGMLLIVVFFPLWYHQQMRTRLHELALQVAVAGVESQLPAIARGELPRWEVPVTRWEKRAEPISQIVIQEKGDALHQLRMPLSDSDSLLVEVTLSPILGMLRIDVMMILRAALIIALVAVILWRIKLKSKVSAVAINGDKSNGQSTLPPDLLNHMSAPALLLDAQQQLVTWNPAATKYCPSLSRGMHVVDLSVQFPFIMEAVDAALASATPAHQSLDCTIYKSADHLVLICQEGVFNEKI